MNVPLARWFQDAKLPFVILSIVIVGCLTYRNALHGAFVMDDLWILEQDRTNFFNYHARLADHAPSTVSQSLTEHPVDISYRPLSQLLPLTLHYFFGKDTFPYHVFNLMLFLGVCLLVFVLVLRLFQNRHLAWLTSILFTAHPINSLMPNYISANIFSLQMILLISSILLFIHYVERRRFIWMIGAMTGLWLAAQCHEISISLPVFLFVWMITVKRLPLKEMLLKLFPMLLLSALLTALWALKAPSATDMITLQNHLVLSPAQYVAGLFQLITWYATKFIFLNGVVLMHVLPVDQISVSYGLGIGLALTILIALTFRKWSSDPVIAWGLLWFGAGLISFVPASRFQPLHGLTIEPHWLYLGSIGLFVVIAYGILFLTRSRATWGPILIGLLLVGYIHATHKVNRHWTSSFSYGWYLLANNPEYKTAKFFMANAYWKDNEFRQAEKLFKESLTGTEIDGVIYNSLGIMADQQGRADEAMGYYEKTLAIIPDLPGTLNNLGIIYTQKEQYEQGEAVFRRAIKLNPWILSIRVNLAKMYIKQKKFPEALSILKDNLEISSGDEETLKYLQQVEQTAIKTTAEQP